MNGRAWMKEGYSIVIDSDKCIDDKTFTGQEPYSVLFLAIEKKSFRPTCAIIIKLRES